MLRSHVIWAVFKRNVLSYFSGVLGYLFIVVFVVAAAFLAFTPQFFANNLANLDQLNEVFPLLLLFIVPAITMSAWADEKKLGTDELLFTLPASDMEILLGKYLSVLAVYSIALLFSTFQLFVLGWYADPDWGLLATTYFGYWLSGAALLSAGMFASGLTSSTTVAFVLGAAICAVPVFIGEVAPTNDFFRALSLSEQFREFGMGLVPLTGVLYFVSLTAFMLYLNLVLISNRHWKGGQQTNMGLQFLVRALCLAVILVSLNVVSRASGAVFNMHVDLTAENLYTLSPVTRSIIDNIEDKRPVTVQAFLSPEVPRNLVTHRKRLLGLLRQYDRLGGGRIEVRYVDVEPFSEQAEEARLLDIQPREVQTERGGRFQVEEVFLGAVISSPYDQVVVPFFETGIPVEYELTRSIRTVSKQERLTVGLLRTDARVNGGFDTQSFRRQPEWQIKAELQKQYNVEEVSPDSPIDEEAYDCLIAVLPSSLTQPQLANLVDYVKKGKPVLVFDDPMPISVGLQLAPRQPKPRPGGMFGSRAPTTPKADNGQLTSLLRELDVAWDNGEVVWDDTHQTLHPQFADVIRPELVFVSPESGTQTAFSPNSPITSGLQEMLMIFSGTVQPRADSDLNFEPLLRTGPNSGLLDWSNVTSPSLFGAVVPKEPQSIPYFADNNAHVLAAHITAEESGEGAGINVIFVADLDCISDQMFDIVQNQLHGLRLDNVTFVLNAVDVLAGDDSYVELRKRRPKHRTLEEVQRQADVFRQQRRQAQQEAEEEADKQLQQRREQFRKRREEIENDPNLTPTEKRQKIEIVRQDEQRRLEVAEANIDRAKQEKIDRLKAREQRQIRALENRIRWRAVLLPPIPAVLLGILVLSIRLHSERSEIEASRHV